MVTITIFFTDLVVFFLDLVLRCLVGGCSNSLRASGSSETELFEPILVRACRSQTSRGLKGFSCAAKQRIRKEVVDKYLWLKGF